MNLTDKLFWIAWGVLLVLMAGCCISESWCEDTAMLGGAYALSLLSTWLCHRIRPRAAYGNLIVMIVYDSLLAYNLAYNSRYGSGMAWWFCALLLNTVHSTALLIYTLLTYCKSTLHRS